MQTLKKLIAMILLLNLIACGSSSLEEISDATKQKVDTTAPESTGGESSTTQTSLGSMGGTSTSDSFILESKGVSEEIASGQNYTLENE